MPRTIRFHLDENCDPAIAHGLRRRGIDATTAADVGLLSADDAGHVAFAKAEGRLIFTQDADFLRIYAAGVEHAGIAFVAQDRLAIGEVIRRLILIWEVYEPLELYGMAEFL